MVLGQEWWHFQCHLNSDFPWSSQDQEEMVFVPHWESGIGAAAVSLSCSVHCFKDALECCGSWQDNLCVRACRACVCSWVTHWASHGIPEVGKALSDAEMPPRRSFPSWKQSQRQGGKRRRVVGRAFSRVWTPSGQGICKCLSAAAAPSAWMSVSLSSSSLGLGARQGSW